MDSVANQLWTSGRALGSYMVCQYVSSGGLEKDLWSRGNPINSPTSLFLAQFCIFFIITRLLSFCLQPLGQSMTVAQILAGVLIGPSFLTSDHALGTKLFPPGSRYLLRTLSCFGLMLHLFIYGVKIDVGSLWKSLGGKAAFIGLSGFFVALAMGGVTFMMVNKSGEPIDNSQGSGVAMVLILNSMTFFIVITGYLNELKISNTEVGALACASSFLVDGLGFFCSTLMEAIHPPSGPVSVNARCWGLVGIFLFYFAVFFIWRPIIIRIIRLTPDGESMRRSHFVVILSIVFLVWFCGECLGQRLCTFVFGLSLPDGPPFGSILVQKLEVFTSGLLLPLVCAVSGFSTNVHDLKANTSTWKFQLICLACRLGKFLGTILSSVFANVPLQDALPLAMIMCCQGIMELIALGLWKDEMLLDRQLFGLSVINVVIYTGILFPLIRYVYDPSIGYKALYRRSIVGSRPNSDLQMLVCIHNEDNVPTIINLLEASKSNRGGSISVIALQLVQLTGRAMPILGPLHQTRSAASNLSRADRIANAFRSFERHSQGYVKVQHFISVSPYSSMHNDICILSHDKRSSLIILPFHKQWAIDGSMVESSSVSIREVNRRVLEKAPCSVAFLIDRSILTGNPSVFRDARAFQVAVLFIGGADDYEALALARRMADHPIVYLTVLWLRPESDLDPVDPYISGDAGWINPDSEIIRDFMFKSKGNDRIVLKEKAVSDGIGTTKALLSIPKDTDLVILGRYHEPDCPATLGINLWNEYPELGMLGDTLVTSTEFLFSVLVLQQQPEAELKSKVDPFSKSKLWSSVSDSDR